MKTTIELPAVLMLEVKLRALHEGRKVQDMVAELLRRGLDSPNAGRSDVERSHVTRDELTGLPLIQCQHPASASENLTPSRVADILLEQEVSWRDESDRC